MLLIKGANLLVRFLLELTVLGAVGYWGFQFKSILAKIGGGLGLPILIAVIWGIFVAPKSGMQLKLPARLIVEFLIFGFGAFALFSSGHPVLGKLFLAVVVVNITLLLVWKQ